MPKKLEIVQDENAPVPKPVLAQAIVDISAALKRLNSLRLTRKAVVVLLAHDTGFRQRTILDVLEAIETLRVRHTTL